MSSVRNTKLGVSMVEITIATGILALIMLPVFLTFSTGNRNLKVTYSEFQAHNAAIELIEQILSLPYDKIPVGKFGNNMIKTGKLMGGVTKIAFNITKRDGVKEELNIKKIMKNGKEKLKEISVTIDFAETKGSKKRRKFVLKTLVANEKN